MHWSTIIYCGIITYLTRFSTIFLLKEDIDGSTFVKAGNKEGIAEENKA